MNSKHTAEKGESWRFDQYPEVEYKAIIIINIM
jgi:hypothetical protein